MNKLRFHHIPCSLKHVGYGYDQNSIMKWHNFMEQIKINPDLQVTVAAEPDSLCASCPGLVGTLHSCKKDAVTNLDNAWKEILKLKDGGIYLYSNLVKTCKEIVTPEIHKKICGKCQWWNICKDTFEKSGK